MLITRPARVLFSCSLVALSSLALGGCYQWGYDPGGPQASRDLFTYESTPDLPQTITLKEVSTDETIWSLEIPVGKQVTIRFYDNTNPRNTARPDLMRWRIFDRGTQYGELDSSIPVPPSINRRVDVSLRKQSEAVAKPDATPAPEPAAK
jgi:hypothetical protein